MQLFAYRNTERGAIARMQERLGQERQARRDAQQVAWNARIDAEKLREQRMAEAAEKARVFAAERKASGLCQRPSVMEIELIACRVFKVKPMEIRSNRRQQKLVLARQFVMYWACRLTPLSLPQIGRLLGGKDHTTVLHGKTAYVEKRALMGRTLRPAR